MNTATLTNGVDVQALKGTIEAVRGNQQIARFQFRAGNRWLDGAHNRTTLDEFSGACAIHARQTPWVFDNDEPPVLLGQDRGANPVEFLLHALAGCLTTSLVYHAAARGITLHEVECRLEGDLDLRGFLGMDEDVRNGYEGIRVVYRVRGDAPEEMLDMLVEMAQRRSPVFDSLSRPVPIQVTRER